MKQKIRMLNTQRGVDDGEIHSSAFLEGEEYDIGPELLQSFIDLGVVELAGEKSLGQAPQNKAHKAAPQNKSR